MVKACSIAEKVLAYQELKAIVKEVGRRDIAKPIASRPTIVGRTNKSMREVEKEEVGEDSRGEDGGVAVDSKEAIGEAYIGAVV
ncbi:hypothetical protein PVK06_038516 [Gossypium arboreum]|uniref:Uncharacterized protein n=1 Tax=Gossypium arboreum TaxID=29729 RepID=A0ABR0N0B6_GOSAR|nr:hypothetical protein PVK06_038516 [Gossypium arboreum]